MKLRRAYWIGTEAALANPWDCMSVTFKINDARLVATFTEDRGAIVEEGLSLEFNEGRCYTWGTLGSGRTVSALEYHCDYYLADRGPPQAEQHVEARVVITGTHENGQAIELRGDGWVGYDERGGVSGTFIEPPSMLVDELDDEPDDPNDPTVLSAEEFEARIRPEPTFPPQFMAAMRPTATADEGE